jgi:hypothetical protein
VRETETIICEGCGRDVDVTRPSGTPLIVEHGTDDSDVVTIRIGRQEVHRCARGNGAAR